MTDRSKMMQDINLLKNLQLAVAQHRGEMLQELMAQAFDAGIGLADVRRALSLGLEQIRHKLMSNETSIPEFLLCIDTMTDGLDRISELQGDQKDAEGGIPIVIGVIEGDPHDIGKNIIAAIYRAQGYEVFDLGFDVPKGTFLHNVEEKGAQLLALSGMMSTTVAVMPDVIREVKAYSPTTVVMVGGAPLDQALAASYGADGYAETAVTVLEETEQAIRRVREGKPWLPLSQS